MSEHLAPDRLRELFLFADLDDDKLGWVASHGDVVAYPAGAAVSVEGAPAECFYVLLEGTMTMSRRVGGDEVETVRTASRTVTFSRCPSPCASTTLVLVRTMMLSMPASCSMRYCDIEPCSDGPRTSSCTLRARPAKYTAACPAEFAPPMITTSWSAHERASVSAAP